MPSVGSRAHGGYVVQESREIGTLFQSEVWWRDHYDDIMCCGYQLRPRYRPGWVPSWRELNKDIFSMEDGQPCQLRAAMDATRLRDGKRVMLKKVLPEDGPHELQISWMFSEVGTDPRNHCVPLLGVIKLPNSGQQLMVTPFLRPFDNPRFQTFGEFVAFFTQVCEGLQFMHERNIAHRDCTANNIMLDPSGMYPNGFHPTEINRSPDFRGRAKRHSRTRRPPRYFLIDFGLSRQYTSRDALDEPLSGDDDSAPEHVHGDRHRWCNPFKTDIYYLGNLVREKFTRKYHGFEFMQDLVSEMTDSDPAKRPLIEEVIARFARICESLSGLKFRSPMTSKKQLSLFTAFRCTKQAIRSFYYVVSNRSAIPQPYMCSGAVNFE